MLVLDASEVIVGSIMLRIAGISYDPRRSAESSMLLFRAEKLMA